jgi:hypothetical protein
MSRRSFPRIDPSALRDHADEERVDRVWERLDQDLGARLEHRANARNLRTTFTYLAVAASFVAFVGGVAVGKSTGSSPRPQLVENIVAPPVEKSRVEVLAAGTQPRTFSLEGGGSLTLTPGATAEIERSGSALTVSLLQGQASIDARGRSGLAVVAGAARITAAAGAVLSVTRGEAELAVKVDEGKASVSSAAGTQDLAKNEQATGVPIRAAVSSAQPDVSPRTGPGPRLRPQLGRPPVLKGAGQPEWMAKLAANDEEGAYQLLLKAGVQPSIEGARTAAELMAIGDIMRHGDRNRGAAVRAHQRVVESFLTDPYAHLAAHYLAEHYKALGDLGRVKQYVELGENLAKTADASFCNLIDQEQDKTKAAQRAMEYLGKYPNGQCRARIEKMLQPEEPTPPAGDPPAPPAPVTP